MGRLKKDHSSWKTSGLWLKYKYPQINEDTFRLRSRKNKRRWCRGKIGVQHEYYVTERSKWFHWTHELLVCKNCKRQLYKIIR